MEFRVLGPIEVSDQGRPIELGSARLRQLLAVLLVNANEVVSADRLVDLVWGDVEPSGGVRTLRTNVSRLRSAIDPERARGDGGRLATRPPGYVLSVNNDELDAARFEKLVADGQSRFAGGDPREAITIFDDALRL